MAVKTMTQAQKQLRSQVEQIQDEELIEKIQIYIRGMLDQQHIESGACVRESLKESFSN
ncbi:MAG: hypothetical protein HFJ79_02930 [Clostridiales bacterium]|nr:hypothetical protein [Clostridiales bacterium]